jgi:hypothetical protein
MWMKSVLLVLMFAKTNTSWTGFMPSSGTCEFLAAEGVMKDVRVLKRRESGSAGRSAGWSIYYFAPEL